jgi:hypothetical protein
MDEEIRIMMDEYYVFFSMFFLFFYDMGRIWVESGSNLGRI